MATIDTPGTATSEDQALAGLDKLSQGPSFGRPTEGVSGRWAVRAWQMIWPKLLALALVLVVWQLIHMTGWKGYVLKGPGPVLTDLWQMAHHSQLWAAIAITMRRAIFGYAIAAVIGTAIGLLVARISPMRAAVGSIINSLQTMPSLAWYPFAIILFGLSNASIVFVMAIGAAPSIANGLITGVDYTPPLLLRAGRTMGLRGFAKYRHLVIPAALPAYVGGLREGWAFAWRGLMAGELLVPVLGQVSVGQLLNTAQDNLSFTDATAMVLVILIIGMVVDTVFTKGDRAMRSRRGLLEDGSAV